VAISSPLQKTCTVVAVARASTLHPMNRHGTEYRLLPTRIWMSGPTVGRDQQACTNTVRGNGFSSASSTAWKTASGAAPSSGRHDRRPATLADQSTAARCICPSEVNSRPRKNESRQYGMGRSTLGLSRGLRARAGSISTP